MADMQGAGAIGDLASDLDVAKLSKIEIALLLKLSNLPRRSIMHGARCA